MSSAPASQGRWACIFSAVALCGVILFFGALRLTMVPEHVLSHWRPQPKAQGLEPPAQATGASPAGASPAGATPAELGPKSTIMGIGNKPLFNRGPSVLAQALAHVQQAQGTIAGQPDPIPGAGTVPAASPTPAATQPGAALMWWEQPHPKLAQLKARNINLPQASEQLSAKAAECLRKTFVEGGPQDARVYSQWGEDGILESVFMCIGTTNKQFAEFGAEGGVEVSTRWLREGHGFKGVLLDGGPENPAINLKHQFVYAKDISDVLKASQVPYPSPDHITIDLDQNTWHVAQAVMKGGWRPRSLIVEFNRNLQPQHSYTVLHDPDKMWDGSCYFGGSLLAFVRLLKPYGYQLVAAEVFGVNLFFVHQSVLGPKPVDIFDGVEAKKRPENQVWPGLHGDCNARTWLEVPEGVDFNTWDASTQARKIQLFHRDQPDRVRVFYEGTAAQDPVQAAGTLARCPAANTTYIQLPYMENFAARLRNPEYAGIRVQGQPDLPWDDGAKILLQRQGPHPPPWWEQPHPKLAQLKARKINLPQASEQLSAKAAECLRKTFVEGGPQDARVYSQWGEDGILESVFMCIGTTNKQYAEFGAEGGIEVSTRWLREGHGFKGVLLDGGPENPAINLKHQFVYAKDISDVLKASQVPYPSPDQMTIDLDQNTWHVAQAVMKGGWRPRSLIVEFNRNFQPQHSFTVMHDPDKMWDGSCYFGGSLLAFLRLLKPYGYQLVAAEVFGINLFFVHQSVLGSKTVDIFERVEAKLRPENQVWPSLHGPCQARTWLEVPEGVDFNTWDASTQARKADLFHLDQADRFRIMYEGGPQSDPSKAQATLARCPVSNTTYYPVRDMDHFAARLRHPEYAGTRVHGKPDLPFDAEGLASLTGLGVNPNKRQLARSHRRRQLQGMHARRQSVWQSHRHTEHDNGMRPG